MGREARRIQLLAASPSKPPSGVFERQDYVAIVYQVGSEISLHTIDQEYWYTDESSSSLTNANLKSSGSWRARWVFAGALIGHLVAGIVEINEKAVDGNMNSKRERAPVLLRGLCE